MLPPTFFNRRSPCASGVLPSPWTVAPVEGVLPSASVLTFSCALEPAGGFCSSLQSEALAGQQSQTSGLSAVPPVCGGSVDLPVHLVSWRPEVGPPPSSSRVTSNLVGEFTLSILMTPSGLVVPSPSVAARDTPVLSSVYPGGSHCLPESVTAACTPVCHVTQKSSLFVLPATVKTHDCRVLLDSGASENFISSSFVSHWGLSTLPLRQPFTV